MKPIRPTLLATAILLSATILCPMPTVAAAAERSSALTAALESITGDELRQHVDYLADDAREGREAGTPGGHAAAQYLQTRLAEMGLRGGAADGGYFQPFGSDYRNVLAVLPGSDPEFRQETILVGAHFDHVGFGPKKDKAGVVASIHNGADDNASGTSGLLEVAQAFC
ncbi:MAG: M28 family peptidase, partial [Planctomycetes bacterium]|nr:M28 family peptidase [Planctomycetota bacterium]